MAEYSGKQPNHVLRDIQNLDCSDDFRKSNFGFIAYSNAQGKKDKAVAMTRDGFMFLVMGYRGKKASEIKYFMEEIYMLKFLYKQDSLQLFFEMLHGIDDMCTIGSETRPSDEIRNGDLLFVDRSRTDYNGNICTVSVADYIDGKEFTERVYISGNEVTLCCATDGDVWRVYPLDAVRITGVVTGAYRPLNSVEMFDMAGHKKMFSAIEKTNTGNYDIKLHEIEAIRTKNRGSWFGVAFDAFRYGFLKGQRAERVKQKGGNTSVAS